MSANTDATIPSKKQRPFAFCPKIADEILALPSPKRDFILERMENILLDAQNGDHLFSYEGYQVATEIDGDAPETAADNLQLKINFV